MKYRVSCPNCGCKYETEMSFAPCFCGRCGAEGVDVVEIKSKSRITAESWMAELDELRPRLEAAWSAWYEVRVAYEDRLICLAQYHKRGVISDEEYDRYRIQTQGFKMNLNEAVREYRKNRRNV